ncbi:hypothetical protein [Furfurilactobacillus rossiae]|uniref:hypothetical protein n=1 Tax=Furfurilactobacillus rossiae TaxID=231049 RepID=UPI000A43B793|nr:hypothetical protein [Furfurilactobacillus rossiae]QFR65867.1 hypothetical protein LR814_01565 [Furfurilactobacillus rossiae]
MTKYYSSLEKLGDIMKKNIRGILLFLIFLVIGVLFLNTRLYVIGYTVMGLFSELIAFAFLRVIPKISKENYEIVTTDQIAQIFKIFYLLLSAGALFFSTCQFFKISFLFFENSRIWFHLILGLLCFFAALYYFYANILLILSDYNMFKQNM